MGLRSDSLADSISRQLGTGIDANLSEDIGDVRLGSSQADEQCIGDFLVGGAGDDQLQYLDFSLRQLRCLLTR